METLNMTKEGEIPHFAFVYFKERDSVIVALTYNEDGTSVNVGEKIPDKDKNGFIPVFGARFYQVESLEALIIKCNEALSALKTLNGKKEPTCTTD